MRKTDEAWDKIFAEYPILETINDRGTYEISANEIKRFLEPRLATKFDHKNNLPKIFSKNGIAILPNSRGTYILGQFEAYAPLETPNTAPKKLPDLDLETLNPTTITSEALALNYAYATYALQDFVGEDNLTPTVSGRMGSGEFSFRISGASKPFEIEVKKSQIEIDAGYESDRSLVLVEAKTNIGETFLVRQLYYPYRAWNTRITKPVRNVYATWVNGTLVLREYVFQDSNDYSSVELVKATRYITPTELTAREIYTIVSLVKPAEQAYKPYPQADSFERVINLIELCGERTLDKEGIASNYDFTLRQVDYYTNAAMFLGMVKKVGSGESARYTLTPRGVELLNKSHVDKQLELVKALSEDKTIRTCILESIRKERLVDFNFIITQMQENNIPLGNTTIDRRARTIRGWVQWVLNLVE